MFKNFNITQTREVRHFMRINLRAVLFIIAISFLVAYAIVMNSKLLLLILLAIATAISIIIRPVWGIYAILIISPFFPLIATILHGNFMGRTLMPTDVLLILVLIGWLWVYISKKERLILSFIPKITWLWVSIILVGFVMGEFYHYRGCFSASRGLFMYLLIPATCCFFGTLLSREKLLKFLLGIFFLINLGIIYNVLGGFNFISISRTEFGSGVYRPRAVDAFATVPSTLISISFLLFYKKAPKWLKLLAWLNLVSGFTGLLLSITRGFALGLIVGLVFITLIIIKIRSKRRILFSPSLMVKFLGIVAICLILTFLISVYVFKVNLFEIFYLRIQYAFSGEDFSTLYRIEETKVYYQSFLRRPILGHGVGSIIYSPDFYLEHLNKYWDKYWGHNEYLWIMQNMGLVGIVAFSLFIVSAIRISYRILNKAYCETDRVLSVSFFLILIASLATSLSSPQFRNITTTPTIAVLYGAIVSIRNKRK